MWYGCIHHHHHHHHHGPIHAEQEPLEPLNPGLSGGSPRDPVSYTPLSHLRKAIQSLDQPVISLFPLIFTGFCPREMTQSAIKKTNICVWLLCSCFWAVYISTKILIILAVRDCQQRIKQIIDNLLKHFSNHLHFALTFQCVEGQFISFMSLFALHLR